MPGHRKSRNAASNLTTGLHHEPHPTKCPSVDTCKIFGSSCPRCFVDDPYLDVLCRSKSGCGPTNDQAVVVCNISMLEGDHRTLYKTQLCALDVLFRKLCRSTVTPPSRTDWSLERHEILHHWNDRARTFAQTAGRKPCSCCVCVRHWKLAAHIANLCEHRWVRRILAWNPSVRYRS